MTTVNPPVNVKPRLRVLPSMQHNIYIIEDRQHNLVVLTRSDVINGYANMPFPVRRNMDDVCRTVRLIP